jgi:hypothetical protein
MAKPRHCHQADPFKLFKRSGSRLVHRPQLLHIIGQLDKASRTRAAGDLDDSVACGRRGAERVTGALFSMGP